MKLGTKIGLAALIFGTVIGGFFIIYILVAGIKYIPQDFIEAKARGAEIAQRIVELSDASLTGLTQIGDFDKAKNYPQAVILVSNELVQNRKIREEAIKLASQLEKMAANLPKIKPAKARQITSEAMGYEVALVSRLISYNDYFNQLFDVLIQKFKEVADETNNQTQELINKINDETQAINELNAKFNSTMADFDRIFK